MRAVDRRVERDEEIAADYIAGRGSRPHDGVGVRTVREWTRTVRAGGAVLDLGCGPGYPMTQLLVDAGFDVYAVDASPTMIAQFTARFPKLPVDCASAEQSSFFDHSFDGVLAWGLLFLLQPDAQVRVVGNVARALVRGGQFLFTAPRQRCDWLDVMTGRRSQSLGATEYRRLVESNGLELCGETDDEGDNHYYVVRKA